MIDKIVLKQLPLLLSLSLQISRSVIFFFFIKNIEALINFYIRFRLENRRDKIYLGDKISRDYGTV